MVEIVLTNFEEYAQMAMYGFVYVVWIPFDTTTIVYVIGMVMVLIIAKSVVSYYQRMKIMEENRPKIFSEND